VRVNAASTVFVLCVLRAGDALAAAEAPPSPPQARPIESERVRVVLRVDGALSPGRLAALERVLRTELEPHGVVLVVEAAPPLSPARLAWVQSVRADPHALLAAVLEVSATGSELYVVDAARGRALLRRLPAGAEEEFALPEAVASIVESAVAALQEGLEVASEPVETVVGEPTKAAPPPSSSPSEPPPLPSPAAHSAFGVLGGVGANVATLADDVVVGGNLSALVRWGPRVATRLGGAFFAPDRITSEYGDFRLQRSTLDLRLAWLLPARPWTLMPELGAALELARRTEAIPRGSASASPDASHVRFGGVLGLRATLPLSSFVAFDAGAHADFYTRSVEFVAGDPAHTAIATLGRLSVGADVGVLVGGW